MNYQESLDFLKKMPQFSPREQGRTPFSLTALKLVLEELGNPEKKLKFVHVAGTNGKGSTIAYLESILSESQVKVGVFTSPALDGFEEMYRIRKKEMTKETFAEIFSNVLEAGRRVKTKTGEFPSVFELLTACAFLYFQKEECELVLLEVGLGGRWDATNIIPKSEIALFTSISFDHTEMLGETLSEITEIKSGIIKSGTRVASVAQVEEVSKVLNRECESKKTPISFVSAGSVKKSGVQGQIFSFEGEEYEISFLGNHQISNACLAIWVAKYFQKKFPRITTISIKKGLKSTFLMGRIQVIQENPLILLDGGHNPEGVKVLMETVEQYKRKGKVHLVFGGMEDKDWKTMINTLLPVGNYLYTVTAPGIRGMDGEVLKEKVEEEGRESIFLSDISKGIQDLKKRLGERDILCIFGSFSILVEAKKGLK